MKFNGLLLFFAAASSVLAGCIQQYPPGGTPSPEVSPFPSPSILPGGGFPEKTAYPLELNRITVLADEESFSVRMLSPTSFELTATVYASTPCSNTTAFWNAGFDELRVFFEHAQPQGMQCAQVLELRSFRAVLDYSQIAVLRPFKKIQVVNFEEIAGEKDFQGMFCGGIAAFQCPYGFDCILDGTYPDAGGKCFFNSSVFDGPRPL